MKLLLTKRLGKNAVTFEVEGRNLFECQMEAQKLSFSDVYKCGLCDSEYLVLKAYKTKEGGYEYVKVVCLKCRASVTFGKKKDDPDTYFLRRKENSRDLDWKAYEPPAGQQQQAQSTYQQPPMQPTETFDPNVEEPPF